MKCVDDNTHMESLDESIMCTENDAVYENLAEVYLNYVYEKLCLL